MNELDDRQYKFLGMEADDYLQQQRIAARTPNYINYGPQHYIKDAYTKFLINMNQSQFSGEMGNYMLAEDELNDLDALEEYMYLEDQGAGWDLIDADLTEKSTRARQRLGIDSSYDRDQARNKIEERRQELLADQKEYIEGAKTDLKDIQDYQNRWEISEYFELKDQDDIQWNIDSVLYKMPGLMGSSAQSWGYQALSFVTNIAALAAGFYTGGIGAAATWGMRTGFAAMNLAVDMQSSKAENAAEVYDNLKQKVTDELTAEGKYNRIITDARKKLKKEGTELAGVDNVDNMTDDQVMDAILMKQVGTENAELEKSVNNALIGVEELYRRDMATTTSSDVVATVVDCLPIGAFSKGTRLGRNISRVLNNTKAKLFNNKLMDKLDAISHFALSKTAENTIRRKNVQFAYSFAKRKAVSALAEGPGEEGIQYLNGQQYIQDKYGKDIPSWVEAALDNAVVDKLQSIWAFISPFDAAEQYDEEWMEQSKSGVLLGMFNLPTVAADVGKVLQQSRNVTMMRAVKDALLRRQLEDKDSYRRLKYYADNANHSNRLVTKFSDGNLAIDQAFDAFKEFMPEVFTEDMWDAEKASFKNIRSLSASNRVKKLAQQRDILDNKEAYNTYVALLEHKRLKSKEAKDNLSDYEKIHTSRINDIRKQNEDLPEIFINSAISMAELTAAEKALDILENQRDDFENGAGININRRDYDRVKDFLSKYIADIKANIQNSFNENQVSGLLTVDDLRSTELPVGQDDLIQTTMNRILFRADAEINNADYNALNIDAETDNILRSPDGSEHVLSEKEVEQNIEHSKRIVKRFMDVKAANENLQQRMRTGSEDAVQDTQIDLSTDTENTASNDIDNSNTNESQGTSPVSAPVPTDFSDEDNSNDSPSIDTPTTKESQDNKPDRPEDKQPSVTPTSESNEPEQSVPDELPPLPDNVPNIVQDSTGDHNEPQNASESDSKPLQEPQTPQDDSQPSSETEPRTEPENASQESSVDKNKPERFISDELYNKAKEALRKKLGNRNAGIDPEALYYATVVGAYHLENGYRKFVDFAKKMIEELGENIKPYLQLAYEGARTLPNNPYRGDMDDRETVDEYVDNAFNKLDRALNPNTTPVVSIEDDTQNEPVTGEYLTSLKQRYDDVINNAQTLLDNFADTIFTQNPAFQSLQQQISELKDIYDDVKSNITKKNAEKLSNQIQKLRDVLDSTYSELDKLAQQVSEVNLFSQKGYSVLVNTEDQVTHRKLLQDPDLLTDAEYVITGFTENGSPMITLKFKGGSIKLTVLDNRNAPDSIANYEKLVQRLQVYYKLQQMFPGRYQIKAIGIRRAVDQLIKTNPGQIVKMTNVSFWSTVLQGYGVADPTDPYQINENNFILAVVDSKANVRRNDKIFGMRSQTNKGWGDLMWVVKLPRKEAPGGYINFSVMINPTRLYQLPGAAETIVEALKQYLSNQDPTAPFIKDGKESPFTPTQVLNLLTYFGNDPSYVKVLSQEENRNRMNKSIYYNPDKNTITVGNTEINANDFLRSEEVQSRVVSLLNDRELGFHFPIDVNQLTNTWGAQEHNANNPLAPVKQHFINHINERTYTLFPGMTFDQEMVGLGEHKKGINWLGFLVSKGLINSGASDIFSRIYASDFQLVESGDRLNETTTKAMEQAIKTDEHDASDEDNPFADAFGEVTLNFVSTDKQYDRLTEEQKAKVRRTIAELTDLTEDQVELLDDILGVTSAGLYIMAQARLDSIVLSDYDIPGVEYHEAWHRISNLLMKPELRRKIFNQVRKKYGKNLTDSEVDEILAERFREFQLDVAEVIDFNTTNLFKRIRNFVKVWSKIGNLRLARIYYRINTGGFKNVKPSEENISRFKALYGDTGPNFTFNGEEFKEFTNRFELNQAIDSLMYYVFYNPNSKVSFYQDAANINFDSLKIMLMKSNKPSMKELANNWPAVSAAIRQRLQQLSIRYSDKEEQNLEQESDSGNLAKVNMDDYTKASYEIDVLGNLTADVKFFFSTVPQYASDPNTGTFKPVLSPITGLPLFYDMRYIFNSASTDLGKCATFEQLIQEVERLAANDNMYVGIKWKLMQYKKLLESQDEATRINAEGAITRILTGIRKQHLIFDTVKTNTTENDTYTHRVVDNTTDYKARILPQQWSQVFANQLDYFVVDSEENVTLTSEGKKRLNQITKAISALQDAVMKNNGILKIGNQSFDLHIPANQNRAKNYIVSIFANLGIFIEQGTITELLKDPKFGVDSYTKLQNFISRSDLTFGGLFKLNELVKSILDSRDLSKIVVDGKAVNINQIFNDSGFISMLANADVRWYNNHDNLQAIGAGNNLLFTKSDNCFISDRTNQLNSDSNIVDKLEAHPWNHYTVTRDDGSEVIVGTSQIIEQIREGKTLSLEIFQNYKTDNQGDLGSDYQQISDVEDYVSKLTLLLNGRVLFPTLEAKKTYYVINGVELPYGGITDVVTSPQIGTVFKFTNQILDQFIRYFEGDRNAVIKTISQLTEGSGDYIAEEDRITNYHTENSYKDKDGNVHKVSPNGTRFRLLRGMYAYELNPVTNQLEEKYIDFCDPIKSSEDLLKLANEKFFNQPLEIKRAIVQGILNHRLKEELQYCIDIGLISGDVNNYNTITSNKLDEQTVFNRSKKFNHNQNSLAIIDIIADGLVKHQMSIIETQKLFIGDPAFFKWKYGRVGDKYVLTDDSVDEIKRHGGLGSTGMNNRTDLDDLLPTYRVAELQDYKQGSDQLGYLLQLTSDGYLREFVKKQYGESAISGISTEELKQKYPELWSAAQIKAKADFGGYAKGINVADAAAYVTPQFYARLMRSVGEWNADLKKAYDILMDDSVDWYTQKDAYHTVMKASLRVLKYMAYGTRFEHGNAVPYFNKMALFPLFKSIATGDMSKLYERMTREDGIDMVMFESAVKVGSKHPTSTNDLDNLVVYNQDIQYLRQQLNTKGHPEPHVNIGTQMMKVILSNLDLTCDYNGQTGEQIRDTVMNCINNLSDRGVQRLYKQFLNEDGELDQEKFSSVMQKYLYNNPNNDNFEYAIQYENGKLKLPLAALSDTSFIESVLLSMISSETIDISVPGGAFIQRSAFGIYSSDTIEGTALNNGKKLKMIDEKDGSMHAIISITMFRDVIPDFDNKTFAEQKKWLLERNIIGENAEPIGIGYRIPTQAQASISALKFVDVLPAVLEDTIILPEEFTKLTGSDFDIDKLFVIRYSFNEKGNKHKYDDSKSIDNNSEKAVKNRLIKAYIKVLTSKDYQQQTKISIDNATERLHDVLDRIEKHRIPTVPSALSSYSLSFQCAKKSEYTIGKLGIGPFALNNAHHVLTQLFQVRMADTPFNKAFGVDTLYKQYDNDGEGSRILDWLSALINAFVDIAKDPFIIRLNVNAYTYNITAYLIRMGYGESVFDLLNQPIIIDISKRIIAARSNFGKDRTKSQFQVEQDIISSVATKYGVDLDEVNEIANMLLNTVEDDAVQPGQYTFSNAVKYKNESFEAFRNVTDGKPSKLSSSDINTRALVLFTIFNNKAKSLSDLVKYSKIDTKKHGKTIAEQRQYYRNMLGLVDDPEFDSSSIEEFLSESFVYTKTYNTINAAYMYGSQLLRAHFGFNDRLDNLLKRMGKFDKADTRTIGTIVNAMESAIKGNFINEILFSTGRYEYLDKLFFGDNSIPRRLLKLKTDIKRGVYPDLVNSEGSITNEFLNYLFPNLLKLNPNIEEPDTIDTRVATNLDINMQNEIIYSWEELLNHPNDEIRELAEDLIYYAFYTSGDQTNPNSFFKFVPASWREESGYGQYLNHILSEEGDTQFSMVNDSDIFLNNWQDDNLVPEVKAYARVENVTPFGIQYETVGRFGLTTKKAFENTTIHPYLFFIGDVGKRNGLNIRPINRMITDDFVGAIYPPYVKINFTSKRDISGWVVYKWIGNVVKEGKMGGYIIQPVYSMVSKKGYNQKGHRIVEYGTSLHLDFNDFIDGLDQPVSEKDINTTAMLQTISKSGLSNELQKILLNDLRNFVPASENYKYYQINDTDSGSLFEEYYESREIEDEATKEPQQVERPVPVQKQTQPKQKMTVEQFAEEWSKAEGITVEDFNKYILPNINKAWNMRFMRITNKVEPFARIKLKSVESINNDNRTSTTVFEDNNQFVETSSLKTGNIVEFYDENGNSALCVVTRPMRKLTDYIESVVQENVKPSTNGQNTINIYAGTNENADLSNLAIRPFTHLGIQFQSVEQAFQFYKTEFSPKDEYNHAVGQAIMMSISGKDLSRLGKQFKGLNQEIWDKMAPTIMRQLILDSFTQNPEAAKRLLDTGNAILTHTQDKGRWGTEFPRLLMEVREELRNQTKLSRTNNVIDDTTGIQEQIQALQQALEEMDYDDNEILDLMNRFHQENDADIHTANDAANLIRKFICNL